MGVEVQTGHDPSGSSSYLTGIIQRVNSPRPDHLIQSLYIGIRLASRHLSVRRAAVGRRIGVSQVPIPK